MMAHWTRRVGLFTLLLVLTGIATGWILYRTDETARLRDRAFVYFLDPELIAWPPFPKAMQVLGISVVYQNVGNMPARRVTVRYDCSWPLTKEVPADPFASAKWKTLEAPNVAGPKGKFKSQGCNIPAAAYQDASRSERTIFIVMKVTYLDGFEGAEERTTEMSRVLRFGSEGEMSVGFAALHNCSDDDCI